MEEADDEEEIPTKKKKQETKKVQNQKLSWFEENVIKKNIEERKRMEKALGLDTLAEDLRKTSKGFRNKLDLVYSSDDLD